MAVWSYQLRGRLELSNKAYFCSASTHFQATQLMYVLSRLGPLAAPAAAAQRLVGKPSFIISASWKLLQFTVLEDLGGRIAYFSV